MLRVSSVLGNRQRLDGGAMFGNAPRSLWSRLCPPDEFGRIELSCRACLVDDGEKKVLLETGIGAFFEPSLRERYGVVEPQHVLLESLSELGLSDADIDLVVLSHLHFDHAGGLLAEWRASEPRRLLFPKAEYVVGSAAFERAMRPHSRDRASFIPELPELLRQSGRLRLVTDATAAEAILGPRYAFRQTFGHTVGMLHTLLLGKHARLFFAADLIPGTAWIHLPLSMGYDRFPEQLIDEKAALYSVLEKDKTFVFFTHDLSVAAAQVGREERGRYIAVEEVQDFADWDLDLDGTAQPKSELRAISWQ